LGFEDVGEKKTGWGLMEIDWIMVPPLAPPKEGN